MNCPYCNSDLSSGAKFCPKCGNRIREHLADSTPKSGSSTGSLIISLVTFLLVAGGGAIGYFYFFAEPKKEEQLKPEEKPVETPPPRKPVEKDQEVPMPDAESSQPQEEVNIPASEDTETSKPMRINSDVVQPVLIHKVNPEYPEIARKARIQGVVILEAIITKEGDVENVKVLRRLHPILDQAALNSVKQWRYKPATLNGRPVKVYATVTVKFTLK